MREYILSQCEKNFLEKAISGGTRLDGRTINDFRDFQIEFGVDWGSCYVSMGETRVLAQVSCEVQQPKASRPNEGVLNINVELNPMAAPHFEASRQSELSVIVNRHVEKCLGDCVDLESLCLCADLKAWALQVDVNIMNHDGNLVDCASVAALAALAHFRRPDVTTHGDEIIVHSSDERDPIPIVLLHYPICVSFAVFCSGQKIIVDPTFHEELVAEGYIVFGVNSYREICNFRACGNISNADISQCKTKATKRCIRVVDQIKELIKKDSENREKGFTQCVHTDKITYLKQQPLSIQLRKLKLREKTKDASPIDTEKASITSLNKNSALLMPSKLENSSTSWKAETDSDTDPTEQTESIVSESEQMKTRSHKEKNKPSSDTESEEEETVVLKSSDQI